MESGNKSLVKNMSLLDMCVQCAISPQKPRLNLTLEVQKLGFFVFGFDLLVRGELISISMQF